MFHSLVSDSRKLSNTVNASLTCSLFDLPLELITEIHRLLDSLRTRVAFDSVFLYRNTQVPKKDREAVINSLYAIYLRHHFQFKYQAGDRILPAKEVYRIQWLTRRNYPGSGLISSPYTFLNSLVLYGVNLLCVDTLGKFIKCNNDSCIDWWFAQEERPVLSPEQERDMMNGMIIWDYHQMGQYKHPKSGSERLGFRRPYSVFQHCSGWNFTKPPHFGGFLTVMSLAGSDGLEMLEKFFSDCEQQEIKITTDMQRAIFLKIHQSKIPSAKLSLTPLQDFRPGSADLRDFLTKIVGANRIELEELKTVFKYFFKEKNCKMKLSYKRTILAAAANISDVKDFLDKFGYLVKSEDFQLRLESVQKVVSDMLPIVTRSKTAQALQEILNFFRDQSLHPSEESQQEALKSLLPSTGLKGKFNLLKEHFPYLKEHSLSFLNIQEPEEKKVIEAGVGHMLAQIILESSMENCEQKLKQCLSFLEENGVEITNVMQRHALKFAIERSYPDDSAFKKAACLFKDWPDQTFPLLCCSFKIVTALLYNDVSRCQGLLEDYKKPLSDMPSERQRVIKKNMFENLCSIEAFNCLIKGGYATDDKVFFDTVTRLLVDGKWWTGDQLAQLLQHYKKYFPTINPMLQTKILNAIIGLPTMFFPPLPQEVDREQPGEFGVIQIFNVLISEKFILDLEVVRRLLKEAYQHQKLEAVFPYIWCVFENSPGLDRNDIIKEIIKLRDSSTITALFLRNCFDVANIPGPIKNCIEETASRASEQGDARFGQFFDQLITLFTTGSLAKATEQCCAQKPFTANSTRFFPTRSKDGVGRSLADMPAPSG